MEFNEKYEDCNSPEDLQVIYDFATELMDKQIDMPTNYSGVLEEKFWDLV